MKITIDLDDVKAYISGLDRECDEWYGPVDAMTIGCFYEILQAAYGDRPTKKQKETLETLDDYIVGLSRMSNPDDKFC